jgi:cytochrome b
MQPQVANRMMAETTAPTEVVWDPLVRVAHWAIVAGFFIAYFTEEDALTFHAWAGYSVGITIVLRIAWGFVGPKHARFSDFLYRPSEVAAYLRDLLTFRAKRYLGHSPAGGAMVPILLVGLTATVGSGLVLYASEENAGPLAGIVTAYRPEGTATISEQREAEDAEAEVVEAESAEVSEGLWEEVHEVAANLSLVLVCLHVAGVFLASFVHRENLARAMLTGRKRPL